MTRQGFLQAGVGLLAGAAAGAAEPRPAPAMPQGKIGNLTLSRLMLGSNLITYYTHSRDLTYVSNLAKHYNTEEKVLETLALAEAHGIQTFMTHHDRRVMALLKRHRDRGGKMQWLVAPPAPTSDRTAYDRAVRQIIDDGAVAAYVFGHEGDTAVEGKTDHIRAAVEIMKANGLPAGVGCHALSAVIACERAKVGADFYVKTFHHQNYPSAKMNHDSNFCPDSDRVIEFMQSVEKPWIAYKVMAAGAIPPQDAFRYAFAGGADFVLAGMFDFQVAEDAQIVRNVLAGLPARKRPWRG